MGEEEVAYHYCEGYTASSAEGEKARLAVAAFANIEQSESAAGARAFSTRQRAARGARAEPRFKIASIKKMFSFNITTIFLRFHYIAYSRKTFRLSIKFL